ncbi:bifunctional DNA-binding transcriptional regulator/O6-methylguanine-DNA methyltransferase Ada [Segnochrobactrum spirostomi]|uniref:methylated-DNA--[protein]-cysteine S-methyltransferase n=1 Tax=Segnochrobactrum spirostomi TaxID=2608987 RepID=A0A6A7Y0G7_9HYPH|nr:bifunctional DNA-binding transcriptional regulator/O6-methylguanine-DNA methyltransferase Ada [Segnochrobactrum spirostomi]MQT12363.1 bifunctional DNA-binding transcriptional regulator/O6-methylguanine-DNA methyltransferase Ada [Segnochrobactrum spirostomi]
MTAHSLRNDRAAAAHDDLDVRVPEQANGAGSFAAEDVRWRAVLDRDPAADDAFVYAVITTGIYCRPTCPSRRPLRGNARFFADAGEASAAGFRPCLRCRPEGSAPSERQGDAIREACRLIEVSETIPSLDALAEAAGLSRFHFHRLFKAATGLTPKAYAVARRAARVREGLARGDSVTGALYEAGFASNGRFYAAADSMLGMKPSDYRAGGRGEEIRFAVGECSLGSILVAESGRGVCAILLGDAPEPLIHEFEGRFPNARLVGGDAAFEARVAQVVGFVEAPHGKLDLPLDIRGTAFQQRVWKALRDIPAGTTITYKTLAARIGQPEAVRGVASACAANAIGVVIPCHRVVRTDGGLAGYRWGIARKQALIAREAQKEG